MKIPIKIKVTKNGEELLVNANIKMKRALKKLMDKKPDGTQNKNAN